MDTYSDEVVSKLKPYTMQQVLVITALFGPLAGGFLVSRSYKAVGSSSRSQTALIVALVMFLFAVSTAIPCLRISLQIL